MFKFTWMIFGKTNVFISIRLIDVNGDIRAVYQIENSGKNIQSIFLLKINCVYN